MACLLDPDPGAALQLNAVGSLDGIDQRDPFEELQFDAGDPVHLGVAHHGSGTSRVYCGEWDPGQDCTLPRLRMIGLA
ncbi:hypothetical protein GCM10027214_11250 [Stenotrophomonas tumulicola]